MKNNKKKLAIAIPIILVIAIIAWIGISVYRFNSPGVHKLFKYYHVEKEGTCVIVDVDDEGIENPIESKYKLNIYFKKRKDDIMDRASGSFSVEKLERYRHYEIAAYGNNGKIEVDHLYCDGSINKNITFTYSIRKNDKAGKFAWYGAAIDFKNDKMYMIYYDETIESLRSKL